MTDASSRPTLLERLQRCWPCLAFALCALGVVIWLSYDAIGVRVVTYEGGSDYWEHSATLRALIEHPLRPRNPHLESTAPSARFGPQFVLVALVARVFHASALGAMSLAAILNTILFCTGVFVFFRTYFRHRLAPLYGLIVMLCGWWQGFHYSNVYQLNVLFTVASYPSTTALGLTFFGFACTVRLLREEVLRPRLALTLLGAWAAAVFIIHPLTAMLSLSGAGLLALSEGKAPLRMRVELCVALALGLGLSHFWPYFSPWRVVHRGDSSSQSGWAANTLQQAQDTGLHVKRKLHEFYRSDGLLRAFGLALVPMLALPYFLLRRERWFVGLGSLAMLLPFVLNAFVDLPLGHRFLLLAMVYLHVGLVWLLLKLTPGNTDAWSFVETPVARRALPVAIVALLGVFTVHTLLLTRDTLGNPRFYGRPESPLISNMKAFAAAAGPNAVVLANPLLSWPLPTFGPKVLVLFHGDPLVPDEDERERAVSLFLGRGTNEQRAEIIRHYGVTHVLLARESAPALLRFLAEHAVVHSVGTGYRLYTLRATPQSP